MTNEALKKETITNLLTTYIEDVLGSGHYATISWQSVEILQQKALKFPAYIHVQISDREGHRLDHPVLWRWSAWKADCESWQRAQSISHRQRVQRFIDEKNLYLVTKGMVRFSGIDTDVAKILAFRKLRDKQYNFIKEVLGVTLITKEEEL